VEQTPINPAAKMIDDVCVGQVAGKEQTDTGGGAMPGRKSPGPSVKKPKTYEALRDKGMSKERSAKIANAQAKKTKAK
jgi:hypothetical protein